MYSDDEHVRAPIPSINERIIDDYGYDYDIPKEGDFEKAISQSLREFNFIQEQTESKLIEEILQEDNKIRQARFVSTKQKLTKVSMLDKQNYNTYSFILSIIELYESGFVSTYPSNQDEYNKIFSLLKTVRLTNEELLELKNLIILE
jgi:hypothetical protein